MVNGIMRIFGLIPFLFFICSNCYSQTELNNGNIDKQLAGIANMTNISPDLRPLIMLDGAPYNSYVTILKSNDIQSIQTVGVASATAIYGNEGKNGAILITTKKYKINSYQGELVYLSKSYRKFTREHNGDSLIKYRLNGRLLTEDKYAIADKLFNIPRKNIKWIRVKKYHTTSGDAAIVSIRTFTAKQ